MPRMLNIHTLNSCNGMAPALSTLSCMREPQRKNRVGRNFRLLCCCWRSMKRAQQLAKLCACVHLHLLCTAPLIRRPSSIVCLGCCLFHRSSYCTFWDIHPSNLKKNTDVEILHLFLMALLDPGSTKYLVKQRAVTLTCPLPKAKAGKPRCACY